MTLYDEPDPLASAYTEGEPHQLDPTSEADALDQATRHLWHIRQLRGEYNRIADVYDRELARINERRDIRLQGLAAEIEWWEAPLRQLHARLLEANPKRKSVHLPYGELRSRTPTKPVYRVTDIDQFIVWAEGHAAELVTRKTWVDVDRRRISATLTATESGTAVHPETGEVVPGVTAQLPTTSYWVTTIDGDGDTA